MTAFYMWHTTQTYDDVYAEANEFDKGGKRIADEDSMQKKKKTPHIRIEIALHRIIIT